MDPHSTDAVAGRQRIGEELSAELVRSGTAEEAKHRRQRPGEFARRLVCGSGKFDIAESARKRIGDV